MTSPLAQPMIQHAEAVFHRRPRAEQPGQRVGDGGCVPDPQKQSQAREPAIDRWHPGSGAPRWCRQAL